MGAQSMVAFFGDHPADALDLAHQASEYVGTALHRAPITAWCELRALATLGHRDEARRAATLAQHHMDTAGRDEPGRFGFDHAELHQHLAEAIALAISVLDSVAPASLRETTRRRLTALDADLLSECRPGKASRDLYDRLQTLPAHLPAQRTSPEPNGQ